MELILEISQLNLLRELQRNTSDRITYQRLTTLIMIHRQMPVAEIADILGVDESTIYRHYNQYKSVPNFDNYLEKHYKPCTGKLNKVQLAELTVYLTNNLCRNSNQIRAYIESHYKIIYTCDGVIALLHRLGFSYKKTRLIPSGCNEQAQLDWIASYNELNNKLTDNEVILFGDGVHPKHNTETDYAWIETGKEFEIPANTARQRININGAINPNNVTEVITHECDTINAITTIVFLSKIELFYPNKAQIHIFVDNARYYRSKLVRAYIENSRIELHFLPPYSPNLNPIERLWKYLKKTIIKSNYTPDFSIFKNKVQDFFSNISNYKDDLESLISTNFQIIKPIQSNLQTSIS
jgi:transposase